MFNKAIIEGNVVRDPEIRQVGTTQVATFSIACGRTYQPKGSENKITDFFEVQAWGNSADRVMKALKRGSHIIVDGAMEMREYTNKEGENRVRWGINMSNFTYCSSGSGNRTSEGSGNGSGYNRNNQYNNRVQPPVPQAPAETFTSPANENDEDLPF